MCWLRVRAFVIELVAELGEALLLGGPGGARWSRGFGFEGFMPHPEEPNDYPNLYGTFDGSCFLVRASPCRMSGLDRTDRT
jgi:hypothetical protein